MNPESPTVLRARILPLPLHGRRPLSRLACALALLAPPFVQAARPAAGSASAPASGQARIAPARHSTYTIDFPTIDIEAASRAMSTILDRPILVDPRVKGQVSLFSDQPVSRTQAFLMYQAALRGAGFSMVEASGLLKVVPEADAKLQTGVLAGAPAAGPGLGRNGDQVQTQVFRLANENANNLVAVLRPLISASNTINANAGNNTLVITDYASNLSRIGALIAALDTPSATDVEVIPLHDAAAADLAAMVQKLSEPGSAAGAGATAPAAGAAAAATAGGVAVMADPHTNSLLVRAPSPARLAAVRALVARLDQPGASASNIHVIYLKHADATRLAQVLRAAFAVDLGKPGAGAGLSGASAGGGAPATGAITSGGASTSAGSSSSSSGAGDTASTQSTTPVTASAQPTSGGFIQADPASNALIVTAPPPLYRELRATIEDLDTRRAQLYVESVVAEVDATKALDVGLQWSSIFNITSSTSLSLGTVAEAIQSTAGSNVLSTANLVTLDNEEAKIVVGQNVPFITGSYTTSSSSTTSPFQTIERKDVGITLRIRPQIGANGTVRMAIYQESSSVAATAATGTSSAGPTTNKRSIETTVVVDDGKIIVLGGLIEDSYDDTREQVPLLHEIPWIGNLFANLSRTRKKTNLLVFLRPVIMRDDGTTTALSMDRYDYIRANQQAVQQKRPETLPGDDGVALPAGAQVPWRPAAPVTAPAPAIVPAQADTPSGAPGPVAPMPTAPSAELIP